VLSSLRGEDTPVPRGGTRIALTGCFVVPHPPIVVPEVGGAELEKVGATVRAMEAVREKAAALAPDTVVLLSPHAPMQARKMGVSLASSYEGTLAYFGAPEVVVEADGEEVLARELLEQAGAGDIPVAVIASPGETLELDHGSMVPLVYLLGGLAHPCRLVLLSFSLLGLQEHAHFGAIVGEVLLEAEQRVLYVASSDLSHRLLPGAPAGFDPRGAEFDRLIAEYFAAGDWRGLLSIDPGVVAAAGECGYRSLAVLSGVVAAAQATGARTENRVLSYEGPFGVGYLVGEVEMVDESRTTGTGR
jgi:aromatic ring-opening dioxygenase LigB subunit